MVDPASGGRVIVEKFGLLWDLDLVAALFPRTKPIFIVRDPRDMLVSMRALNEQRGFYDFHEISGKSFSALLPIMSVNLHHLVWHYERWPGEKLLLRYEDVIGDLKGTLVRVLDVPGSRTATRRRSRRVLTAAMTARVTSHRARRTIRSGRWRTYLSQSQIELANWFFEPFMRRFGYSD